MSGPKYPETILVKLEAGTKDRIKGKGVSNQNAWVRGLIEDALRGGAVGDGVRRAYRGLSDKGKGVGLEGLKVPDAPNGKWTTPLREQDKADLLALVREHRLNSRAAEARLGWPGLRYRNAEAGLMADGLLFVRDGFLEALD